MELHCDRTAKELAKAMLQMPNLQVWLFADIFRTTQGANTMKKQNNAFEICLCNRCASVFYNSPSHRISRVDPLQVIKDTCDCCRSSKGYDFLLRPNVQIRPRVEGDFVQLNIQV